MKAPRDHLKTIQRRADFLKSLSPKNSFDLAELGALEWALVNLQAQRKPMKPIVDEGLTAEQRLLFKYGWKSAEAAHGIKENT